MSAVGCICTLIVTTQHSFMCVSRGKLEGVEGSSCEAPSPPVRGQTLGRNLDDRRATGAADCVLFPL